jgi:hypothetical protein
MSLTYIYKVLNYSCAALGAGEKRSFQCRTHCWIPTSESFTLMLCYMLINHGYPTMTKKETSTGYWPDCCLRRAGLPLWGGRPKIKVRCYSPWWAWYNWLLHLCITPIFVQRNIHKYILWLYKYHMPMKHIKCNINIEVCFDCSIHIVFLK